MIWAHVSGLRWLFVAAVLAGCLPAACSPAESSFPRPIPVTLKSGPCDTIVNTERCAQAIEAHQLSQTPSGERTERGVCFDRLESCIPPDTTAFPGNATLYYLGTLAEPPFHVFWAQYSEGNSILLVHRSTGRRLWADAIPVPSPSGERVAVASADLFAQYNPNRLTILDAIGDSLAEQWTMEPREWGPASVTWASDAKLRVRTIVLDSIGSTEVEGDTVIVEKLDDHWQLMSHTR